MIAKIKELFYRLFGKHDDEDSKQQQLPLFEILRRGKEEFEGKWNLNTAGTARLSDFELIKTLGRGKFGRVMLVAYRPHKRKNFLAMKVMNKRIVLTKSNVSCVLFEKRILQSVSFPFLVQYKCHFKDNANLYLVLQFVPGGDMFTHLRKAYRFDGALTHFYAAQLTISLEYLHHLGIVHRDIKPENIMIAEDGFLRITDFGLAKRIGVRGRTSTKCGTRVYMAPELLAMKRNKYGFNADWWSLGVLIYEMTVGKVPFDASNSMEMLYKISKHDVKYPAYMHSDTVHMVRMLLDPNIKVRLVSADSVKTQPFFRGTNWEALYYKKVKPPFVPTVRSNRDTSNFDRYTEERLEEWQEDVFRKEFEEF